jgi:hypothetical protein
MKKAALVFAAIILFSVNCNCQWYYKKYGVKDINQLSREQLNERLSMNKKIIGLNVCIMIVGTGFIIGGTHLINKANAEEVSLEGAYDYTMEKTMGIVLLSSGILCDIGGLILKCR